MSFLSCCPSGSPRRGLPLRRGFLPKDPRNPGCAAPWATGPAGDLVVGAVSATIPALPSNEPKDQDGSSDTYGTNGAETGLIVPDIPIEEGICRHFGVCGGCKHQDLPYEEQLAAKEAHLRELFGEQWEASIPVAPSPVVQHYRNKVDFNIAPMFYDEPPPKGFVRETVVGFKCKGRWFHPLDIEECRIAPEGVVPLLEATRTWIREQGLHAFDSRTNEGFLKILLVREGRRTGERMVVLITGPGTFDAEAFVRHIAPAYPATSIHHAISESPAGVAFAEETRLLSGNPVIHERLDIPDGDEVRSLQFRLSPFSFFQTNTLGTERLYGRIRQWVKSVGPTTIEDLYGGSGGIAFACADLVDHATSVESVSSASEDGRYNAETNGIENVTFITEKVKNYLLGVLRSQEQFPDDALVIVDPPRAGLHPKTLRRLIELRPAHVIYVSCKPLVFSRDELPALTEHYWLEALEAFDLFPHTPHVEVLTHLERR